MNQIKSIHINIIFLFIKTLVGGIAGIIRGGEMKHITCNADMNFVFIPQKFHNFAALGALMVLQIWGELMVMLLIWSLLWNEW